MLCILHSTEEAEGSLKSYPTIARHEFFNAILVDLKPNKRERITLPIFFGEEQKQRVENALRGEWAFSTVDIVKRNGEWYAHFVLKRTVELVDEPETIVAIDGGVNLATAIAISKSNPEKPMKEDLNGIRKSFKKTKKLNKCFHSLPFRKLQTIVEYKALLECILVRYLTKKETKNTSKTCHSRGHVAQVEGRIYKCPNCGMEYDRDLNACINIAHRVMSSMGWGVRAPRTSI